MNQTWSEHKNSELRTCWTWIVVYIDLEAFKFKFSFCLKNIHACIGHSSNMLNIRKNSNGSFQHYNECTYNISMKLGLLRYKILIKCNAQFQKIRPESSAQCNQIKPRFLCCRVENFEPKRGQTIIVIFNHSKRITVSNQKTCLLVGNYPIPCGSNDYY